MRTDYTREIAAVASAYRLSADLLEAQVLVESSGRADAFRFEPGIQAQLETGKLKPKFLPANRTPRRIAASYGLLQILFVTATDYGFIGEPEALFQPAINLTYGAEIMSDLLTWAGGDFEKALCAYNGGRGAVKTIPFTNRGYALRVFAAKEELLKT